MNHSLTIALDRRSQSDGPKKDHQGSFPEGLTAAHETPLRNPAPPSGLNLFASASVVKRKRRVLSSNLILFAAGLGTVGVTEQ